MSRGSLCVNSELDPLVKKFHHTQITLLYYRVVFFNRTSKYVFQIVIAFFHSVVTRLSHNRAFVYYFA